jgi:hypothetical protein
MAERPRMTAAQLADKLLADEHADVLRESVAWMAAQLMETDIAAPRTSRSASSGSGRWRAPTPTCG